MLRRLAAPAVLVLGGLAGAAAGGEERTPEAELLEALGDVALYVEPEVLVAGATRRVAKLSEAPGTITVIDAGDLERLGVLTLEDVLRHVASVLFEPGVQAVTPTFRGIGQPFGNKILLLQDGRILNDVVRGTFFVDLTQPVDDVLRVEVVRGPGSALYGANAFAGFVNLVTRRGADLQGVEIRGTAGARGLDHEVIAAGGVHEGTDWRATLRHARTDGEDPVNPARPNARQEDASLDVRLGRSDARGDRWFVTAFARSSSAGVPGAFAFPTPGDSRRDERGGLDGFRRFDVGRKTKLQLRLHHVRHDATDLHEVADAVFAPLSDAFINQLGGVAYGTSLVQLSALPGAEEPDDPAACAPCDEAVIGAPAGLGAAEFLSLSASGLPMRRERQSSSSWSSFAELQVDHRVSSSNYLLGGLSSRWDDLDDSSLGAHRFRTLAVFVEDEQRFFGDRLILLGSLRLDDHSFFGRDLSPRASAIWSPARSVVLKASWGRAFRSPNFVELFGATRIGTASIFGQRRAEQEGLIPPSFTRVRCLDPGCASTVTESIVTSLRPESIETLETRVEWSPVKRLRLALNLHEHVIEDEVGLALDRNDVFALVDGPGAVALRPSGVDRDGDTLPDFTLPVPSLFAVPGLEDVPTLGVFLNSPDRTRGRGFEVEVNARPTDSLRLAFSYSRSAIRQALVGDFVERDAASTDQQLVPTYGLRRYDRDQAGGLVGWHRKDRAWATVTFRLLGVPDRSCISSGGSFTADVSAGGRFRGLTLAGTVVNVNGAGVLFDPETGRFAGGEPDWRVTASWRRRLGP